MKAPPKRKGNPEQGARLAGLCPASMKAPPKRKGNAVLQKTKYDERRLNESPSEKEGKFVYCRGHGADDFASMKAPPKRKGNLNVPRVSGDKTKPQ